MRRKDFLPEQIVIRKNSLFKQAILSVTKWFSSKKDNKNKITEDDFIKYKATDGVSSDLIKKIRAIHLHTSHLVNELVAGEYRSAFKGQGMEFEDVREYMPGDEIRAIDWNVTARTGHPYVKNYCEERELTVLILVDVSFSVNFGSSTRMKQDMIAELAAVLAYTAIRSHDKVGLLLFTDRVERYIPPKKGRGHVWRVIREVLEHRPMHKKTDIKAALEFLKKVNRRHSVCFLISDFIDEDYQKALHLIRQIHDVIAISVSDPREKSMPNIGLVELEDSESSVRVIIDTSDEEFNKAFKKNNKIRQENLIAEFRSMKVDLIEMSCEQDTLSPLMKYFRMREKRMI